MKEDHKAACRSYTNYKVCKFMYSNTNKIQTLDSKSKWVQEKAKPCYEESKLQAGYN